MDYYLRKGKHTRAEDGRCAMEWVAYLAGEEHSDSPVCVSPVLRQFGIGLNDRMPDEWRQKLRPYLARMIGTAGDGLDEQRIFVLADWAVRTVAPLALDACGRDEKAAELRALPEVVDAKSAANAAYAAAYAATAAYAANAAYAAACAATVTYAANAAYATAVTYAANAAYAAACADVWRSALEILNRILPTEVIQIPVASEWREVCGV